MIDEIKTLKYILKDKLKRQAQIMEDQKKKLQDKTGNEVPDQIKAFEHIAQQPPQPDIGIKQKSQF